MPNHLRCFLSVLFACSSAGIADAQSTYTISPDQPDAIQVFIDEFVQDGDVIQLAAGTYVLPGTIATRGKAITLRGVLDKAGEPASVLDGAGTHRVLICQSGETSATVFENLVIRNGAATGSSPANRGGGMYNEDSSSPTLINCAFTSNSASDGGGMFNLPSWRRCGKRK